MRPVLARPVLLPWTCMLVELAVEALRVLIRQAMALLCKAVAL